MSRSLRSDEELVPLRKRVVLAFSCTRGSCLARARFERAFLGLLRLLASKGRLKLPHEAKAPGGVLTFVEAS